MTQKHTAATPNLPEVLCLSDPGVREQLQALPDSLVLIGLTTDGQPVCVDLDAGSPHVLVCSGTGGGTSTVLRTLTAQFLHHGGHALVLDLKRISHRWAQGLPGVTYCRDIADIHDALVGLQAELVRRLHHIDQHGDADDLPRLTVVFEVADATLNRLARHWDTVREKGAPKTSPAIDALEELFLAGPQTRMHVLLAGHLNRPFGPEARESFSTLVLGRVTTGTWERLAPHIGTVPKGKTHPGCVHVVQGLRNGSRRYRALAKTTVLKPSAASLWCEWTMAWCWARTTSSSTRRLSGRRPCRSRQTGSGVATTTTTVGMPCRLAAITSSTRTPCSTLVASITVLSFRAIRRCRISLRTSAASVPPLMSHHSHLSVAHDLLVDRVEPGDAPLPRARIPAGTAAPSTTDS
ncbi:hypothetical protein GCM10010259_69020 [Streptomyces daghestanicus]|uniref:FtsK domain-containing protein n=1 Tax=Streptomyces daghestanicus TaxID=66885 RepID=A0ABQ3Q7F0_9ACTN|nr:hypothetical protein GCM10010259_69020 [Streptomyces daghestanicus]GHI33182.1 hypothetical protein Sdagh_49120 [Streptomyces daghestanicus]